MNADMFKQGMQFAKSATEADARGEYLPALNLPHAIVAPKPDQKALSILIQLSHTINTINLNA